MDRRLNFARAPFRNERLGQILYTLAAALVVAATIVHAIVLTRSLLREREAMDVRVQELEARLAELDGLVARERAALEADRGGDRLERIRFLAELYQRKSFSWTGLFNELEAITPQAVRITSVEPAWEEGQIQVSLTVVGRTLDDVLEMVRRLEGSRLFGTVLPRDESHDERRAQGVVATLTLRYEAAAPSATPSPPEVGE